MSTPFQNRLVGTIIVAAIAIIFLPDILDGEKKTYQDKFEKIPTAPKVKFPAADKKFPKEKLQQLPQEKIVDESALDEKNSIDNDKLLPEKNITVTTLSKEPSFSSSKANVTKEKPAPKQAKQSPPQSPSKVIKEQAWAIQLGSFRHQNNVDTLVQKLTKSGYTVFTKPIKTKQGKLTKVFVGPELNKATLDKKLPSLKKLTNVQGKVARFYPTK